MKILPYSFQQTKVNYANKFNLYNFKVLSCDTFERRNISFEAVSEKYKNAVRKDPVKIARLEEFDELGILPDIGTAIAYLDFIDLYIDEYNELSEDSELNIMDKMGLIAYEIDDIERYKTLKQSLAQYEAILATKFALDDSQIQTYLSKKAQPIQYEQDGSQQEYIPSDDELMLCVKEGFDEAQLKRFAQLRNRELDFTDKSVRRTGGKQNYPIKYIVDCIKNSKTDDDIEKEHRLVELMDMQLPIYVLVSIMCLSNDGYNRFKQIIGEIKDIKHALTLSKLSKEEYARYERLIENGEPKGDAIELAKLSKEEYARYKELRENGEFRIYAFKLAKLPKEEYARYKELIEKTKKYISKDTAIELSKLSKEEYARYKELRKGVNKHFAVELAKLSKEEYARYKELIENGEDEYIAFYLAQLSEEECVRYKKLIENGEYHDFAFEFVQLSEEEYARYERFIENGENKYGAIELAKLSKEEYARYKELIENGEFQIYAFKLAKLSEEGYARLEKLIENGENKYSVGENEYNAIELAQLSEEEYARYERFLENYKSRRFAYELAKLPEEVYVKYERFLDNGEDDDFALELAKLSEAQYLRYTEIPMQVSEYQALMLAKNTNLTSVTPEILEKLSPDFWNIITKGCDKESSDIFRKVITLLLSNTQDENLQLSPLKKLGAELPCDKSEYVFDKKSGDFDFIPNAQDKKPFSLKLSQGLIEQKPFLVVQDKQNSSNQYISYNGAIACIKPLQDRDVGQFLNWGILLPKKQAEILAKAADEFVFNLFDENGNCIIGQNSSGFNINEKTDSETETYYSRELLELKDNSELTAQNILKLMPKDCMLAISPYIQGGNILYSIVVEWFSKDGNRWQMEIHSQDINFDTDEKWTFRLHKENNGTRQYFEFDENGGCNFNGVFNGLQSEKSHIKISTPLDENDLLNSIDFQKIIKEISSKLSKDYLINNMAGSLNVVIDANNTAETAKNIINHCLKNPADFARYKDEILAIRRSFGMADLV